MLHLNEMKVYTEEFCKGDICVPKLGHKDIHLWCAYLPKLADEFTHSILEEMEQQIFNRYLAANKRIEFKYGRFFLKRMLAYYVNTPVEQLSLSYERSGKPYIVNHPLHFSLAHTDPYYVGAVSLLPIGVDVERLRPISIPPLTPWFHKKEMDILSGAPKNSQLPQFFELWTLREAMYKYDGKGTLLSLGYFSRQDESWNWEYNGGPHPSSYDRTDSEVNTYVEWIKKNIVVGMVSAIDESSLSIHSFLVNIFD